MRLDQESEPPYPHLRKLIELISLDNGISNKAPKDYVWPENVGALESAAATLSEADKETVAMGDQHDAEKIIAVTPYGHALNHFLNEAFDGALYENFFVNPGNPLLN